MPIASVFRSALRWFCLASIALVSPLAWAQGTSAADGFDPNVNGNVHAVVVQPDGKILVAGKFDRIQPNGTAVPVPHNNIARLLADGRNDSTFTTNINDQVNAMALQADGKIVIGGRFTSVEGATRNRAARLNVNGSLDTTFDPNLTGVAGSLVPEVMAIVIQSDGKVVLGGGFTQAKGAARNRLARFNADGTLDGGFDPDAKGLVLALALQANGKILVGGGFTGVGGSTVSQRIARLNADGTVDATFSQRANNAVSAIDVLPDGRILIGGTFTSLQPDGGEAKVVTNIARLETNGSVSAGFLGTANGAVSVIKVQRDGSILVGGSFSALGGGQSAYVARLLPGGASDLSFSPGANFSVYAIALQNDGSVVFGGGFTTMRGTGRTSLVRNHVARVSSIGGLDADFRPDANGRLQAIGLQSDKKILVGGSFTSVAGSTRRGLVRLSPEGKVEMAFNADVDGPVTAFAQQENGKIVIGGSFSRVGGLSRSNVARLNADGTVDEAFDPSANNQVNAIAIQSDGKIIIGGGFTQLRPFSTTQPVSSGFIARINADGTVDTAFTPTANGSVNAIVIQSDGKILVGGSFSGFSPTITTGARRLGLARLNTDGTLDTAFDPTVDGTVSAIAVQSDGAIVFGGSFVRMAPNNAATLTERNNLARVTKDGAVDTKFDPSPNGSVNVVAVQTGGKILVGGRFTTFRPNKAPTPVARTFFARLETNGTVDTSLNLNLDEMPGGQVVAIAQPSDAQVLVGGAFTSVKNPDDSAVSVNRLARISSENGTVDPSFNADMSAAAGAPINALVSLSDDSVLAAGSFAGINGTASSNLARFTTDSAPDTNFAPTINGPVHTVAQLPTKGAPRPTQRTGFAWLKSNGELRTDFTFASDLSLGSVIAIAVQPDGKVITAGSVDSLGTTGSVARFNPDGSRDLTFQPAAKGTVTNIVVQSDGKILIAGEFTAVGDVTRNNIARLNADGTLDAAFNPNASAVVLTMRLQGDNKILIGGNFTSIQPTGATSATARSGIARLNADGTLDADFNPTANNSVLALSVQSDGKIWIGGNFSALQPNGATTTTTRNFIARLNANGTVDETIDLKANGAVASIAAQSDAKLVLGGYFNSMGGSTRNYLARLNSDGSLDASFNPNANNPVATVAVQPDGKILAGGPFSAFEPGQTVHNVTTATPRNRAVRLLPDGKVDPTFNPNFDNTVTNIYSNADGTILVSGSFGSIQPSGSLLVGGTFTTVNGLAVSNIALFGSDGSVSSTFQPNPDGAVYALLPQIDGQVVIGGAFTKLGGVDRKGLARFKTDDTLDTGFNPAPDKEVFTIVRQPDGKYLVGGAFTTIGGASRSNLARLNVDGTNDSSFSSSVSGAVRSIALQADGRILVTQGTAATTNQLLRLNANGSADGTFTFIHNGLVSSMAVQTDGGIIIGGSFTTVNGATREYLARLTSAGALDTTLTSKPNGAVTALTIQRNGKILIAGTFSAVDGLPRFGLARLSSPVPAADTFAVDGSQTVLTWNRMGGSPEVYAVLFERSTDAFNWTDLGEARRIAGTSNWQLSNLSLSSSSTIYVRARGIVPAGPQASAGVIRSQGQLTLSTGAVTPVVLSGGVVNGASGSSFSYITYATGNPTSYAATGLPAGLTINSSTGAISGTPTQQGTFSIVLTATNAVGSGSSTLTLIVGAPGSVTPSSRVVNLSVLAQAGAGDPIIAGFVITGSTAQDVLLRAVGPGLTPLGVTGALAAPNLKVYRGTTVISESNSWGGNATLAQQFVRLGASALSTTSADAAVFLTLQPGPYSLWVSGTGTALAEVYDASTIPTPNGAPRLVNISARGTVTAGSRVTGGFVITGSSPRRVLVRGVGPGLAGQNVSNPLSNPVVRINHIISQTAQPIIAENNDWQTPVTVSASYPAATGAEISAAATQTGAFAFATGSLDAAVLVTLQPGIYTADVSGSGTATGPAMVEIYEVP